MPIILPTTVLGCCISASSAVSALLLLVTLSAPALGRHAALCQQAGRWDQALWALKEATRLSRDSWQVWSNYSLAAWRAGDWAQAAKGCLQVLQLSQGQVADLPLVQSLVAHVVEAKRSAGTHGQPRAGAWSSCPFAEQTSSRYP